MRASQQPRETAAHRRWRIRTACAIATAAAVIAVINPAAGYAAAKPSVKLGTSTTATCSRTFPEICSEPSSGNDIVGKVNLGKDFTRSGLKVTLVCLNFTFDPANPFGPGDEYQVAGYGGALNGGSDDLLYRQSCFSDYDMNLLEEFQDGRATLHIYAFSGSFTVVGATVTYTAVPLS
jgi:hypothetical protein